MKNKNCRICQEMLKAGFDEKRIDEYHASNISLENFGKKDQILIIKILNHKKGGGNEDKNG